MAKGNRAKIQWADGDKHRHYLVTFGDRTMSTEDEVQPFGFASMSEIVDKISDDAYANAMGEDPRDIIEVWRLTNLGPVPVDVTYSGYVGNGVEMVQITFTWVDPWRRDPDTRKRIKYAEHASYRVWEV